VGPRTGLDDVERRKTLSLPGLELRPLGRWARSQSLYRLPYLQCRVPLDHSKRIRYLVSYSGCGSASGGGGGRNQEPANTWILKK
jgi:hypothetical protein